MYFFFNSLYFFYYSNCNDVLLIIILKKLNINRVFGSNFNNKIKLINQEDRIDFEMYFIDGVVR